MEPKARGDMRQQVAAAHSESPEEAIRALFASGPRNLPTKNLQTKGAGGAEPASPYADNFGRQPGPRSLEPALDRRWAVVLTDWLITDFWGRRLARPTGRGWHAKRPRSGAIIRKKVRAFGHGELQKPPGKPEHIGGANGSGAQTRRPSC